MYFKKMMSLVIALIMLLISSTSLLAAQKPMTEEEWAERRAFLEQNIAEIGSQGFDKVDQWLQANGVHKLKQIEKTDEAKTKSNDDISTMSSGPGNVDIYGIDGYRDSYSGYYLVKGWWEWLNISYVDRTAGALEGVSLSMSRQDYTPTTGYVFKSYPAGMSVYDQDGTYYPDTGASTNIDQSGVSYAYQDAWIGTKYRGYKGQAWFWLFTPPEATYDNPIYLRLNYIHTYTDANLEAFGLSWNPPSPATLSMNFSTTPSQWPQSDQYTIYNWRNN